MPNGNAEAIRLIMRQYGVDFGTAKRILEGEITPEEAAAEEAAEELPEGVKKYEQDVFDYLKQFIPKYITPEQAKARAAEAYEKVETEGYHRNLPYFREMQEALLLKQDIEKQAEAFEEAKIEKSARFFGVRPGQTPQEEAQSVEAYKKTLEAYKGKPGLDTAIERREEGQRKARKAHLLRLEWLYNKPEPYYGTALEEERTGLEGPQPYKRWFESKYSSLVSRFAAPRQEMFEREYWPAWTTPKEAGKEIEKSWAGYLKKEVPKVKEEFYMQSPYEREERVPYYQPRIRTVKF